MDPDAIIQTEAILETAEKAEASIKKARQALTRLFFTQRLISSYARRLRSLLEAEKRRRAPQKRKGSVPKRRQHMARELQALPRLDTPKSKGSHGKGVSRKPTSKGAGLMPTGK